MKKNLPYITGISFVLVAFLLSSCISEETPPQDPSVPNEEEEYVKFSLTANLPSILATRDDNGVELGNGQKVSVLHVGLCDSIGNRLVINKPGEKDNGLQYEGNERHIIIKDYPFFSDEDKPQVTFEILKGVEYTVILWAESKHANENNYFDLENQKHITMNRNTSYENNDEYRDSFCFQYKLRQFEDTREKTFTLSRPFAQINIGVEQSTADEFPELEDYKFSSLSISRVGNAFDIFNNRVIREDVHNTVHFAPGLMPFKMEPEQKLIVEDRNTGEEDQYIWLSMCYTLPPIHVEFDGEEEIEDPASTSFVDLSEFYLYKEKPESTSENNEVHWDMTENNFLKTYIAERDIEFTDIPVRRNHRTNIILTQLLNPDDKIESETRSKEKKAYYYFFEELK